MAMVSGKKEIIIYIVSLKQYCMGLVSLSGGVGLQIIMLLEDIENVTIYSFV